MNISGKETRSNKIVIKLIHFRQVGNLRKSFRKKSINTQTALAHSIKIVYNAFTLMNGGIVTIRHRIPRSDHDIIFKK
jgi:hypothetical protein